MLKIAGLPEPLKHKPSDTIPFLFSKKKCGYATTLQTLEKDKVIQCRYSRIHFREENHSLSNKVSTRKLQWQEGVRDEKI